MKHLILFCASTFLLTTMALAQTPVVKPNVKPVIIKKTPLPVITTKKVDLENIEEWLCPSKHTKGDREFDGHGPKIKCEVKLRIGRDSTTLWADITFSAIETVHDWSTVEGTWSKKVFDAPYGEKIMRIKSDKASRTQFTSPAAGFQFLFPGDDVKTAMNKFFDGTNIANYVLAAHGLPAGGSVTKESIGKLVKAANLNGNTVVTVPATEGALVKFFHIVGDTGGDDISNDDNCNDDTRINKIEFFPVQIDVKKTNN